MKDYIEARDGTPTITTHPDLQYGALLYKTNGGIDQYKGPTTGWKNIHSPAAKNVNHVPGPQTQARNRWLQLDNAGTREKAEWPSGANIKELTFFAAPVAGTAAVVGDEYVAVAIDAADDPSADAMLTQVESSANDINWIPIPLYTVVRIPLTDALSNGTLGGGRVDAKTVGGVALDLWIGGN